MAEELEQMQSRHRKEAKDLQGRVTNKKKNANKKTRKGVNDECADLERQLRERHQQELQSRHGSAAIDADADAADSTADADAASNDTSQPPPSTLTEQVSIDAVADQLQQTSMASEPQPQQQQQQQPPKKRNRQKERLARRAAEQEADVAAAREEAANMTDHRGIERERMDREFAARGLIEEDIAPDGHCLFAAVADQLAAAEVPLSLPGGGGGGGDEDDKPALPYRTVRRAAADYMEAHADEYAGFLEEPLVSYAARMRDTAEWGGQLELSALANAYGFEIRVVQGDGRTEVVAPAGAGPGTGSQPEPAKTLWLAYYRHGYGLGEHYNSLRKKAP